MLTTPKANRLHVGIFGRINTGKSSLLNWITQQQVSISSPIRGTTTDVVEKAMELLPLGPVLFLDTAGLDDTSELGALRAEKTQRALNRTDVAVLVTEPDVWTEFEEGICRQCQESKRPLVVIVNKTDLKAPSEQFLKQLAVKSKTYLTTSCVGTENRDAFLEVFKRALIEASPDDYFKTPALISDLVPAEGLIVLVVPIDSQAPKGRLILPQVQTIREALDHHVSVLVVTDQEYPGVYARLKTQPDLVVCDSQAVLRVVAATPASVKLTTFSILFARIKGELSELARGAAYLETLRPGDAVVIAEGCSHHALEDDIGRIKIPNWLRKYVGGDLRIDTFCGREFPENPSQYRVMIHCGACTLNRREMLYRIQKAKAAGLAVTNYGIAISFLQGVGRRALEPFPTALQELEQESRRIRESQKGD